MKEWSAITRVRGRVREMYGKYLTRSLISRHSLLVYLTPSISCLCILAPFPPQGERVLVFSQFTTMLDVLEVVLDLEGHVYLRLDGQTPVEDRWGGGV